MESSAAEMGASLSHEASGEATDTARDVLRLKRKASSDAEAVAELTCLQAKLRLAPPPATTAVNAALDEAVAELLGDTSSCGPPPPAAAVAPAAPAPAPTSAAAPAEPAGESEDVLPATQELPATQPAQEAEADAVPPPAPAVTPPASEITVGEATPAEAAEPASPPASIVFPSPGSDARKPDPGGLVALTPELLRQGQDWRDLQVIVPTPAAAAPSGDDTGNSWAAASGGAGALRLAGYLIFTGDSTTQALGSGGLGSVYLGRHLASGAQVAIKLGHDFVEQDGRDDFSWWSFLTEWNVYSALSPGGSGSAPWPRVYEMGLVRTETGVAPWISMEVVGSDLHTLNRRGRITPTNLASYGRGALAALQALHIAGYVHVDVKNANFCTRLSSAPEAAAPAAASASGSKSPASPAVADVVLVDFGFAQAWSPETAHGRWSFVGTPDFASARCLRGARPAPRDDLEALGFCLLELALGDLPWDVTRSSNKDGGTGDSLGWTNAQLAKMADKRETIWHRGVADGAAPAWLVRWIEAARALLPTELPDYSVFRQLLADQALDAAIAAAEEAAAAAKAAANAAPAEHLLWAEE